MSNSPLVRVTKLSPNRTAPRNHAIDRVSVHCFVGQVTAESGLNAKSFADGGGASCNYVVGHDGSIGLCVPESDRSWCTSDRDNDHRAVTIEVASETKSPYAVTEAAYAALVELLSDICRRNGKTILLWLEDKDTALAYVPRHDEMVMTVHRWFANKSCPGEYLLERHGALAKEVTRRLSAEKEPTEPEEAKQPSEPTNAPSAWASEAAEWCKAEGIMVGDEQGNFHWQRPLTREELAVILFRMRQ